MGDYSNRRLKDFKPVPHCMEEHPPPPGLWRNKGITILIRQVAFILHLPVFFP
jgi:hypothetical protein